MTEIGWDFVVDEVHLIHIDDQLGTQVIAVDPVLVMLVQSLQVFDPDRGFEFPTPGLDVIDQCRDASAQVNEQVRTFARGCDLMINPLF